MQQINLYRRRNGAGPRGRFLAGADVLLMLGIVAVALVGISVFTHLRLQKLDAQLGALRAQQDEQTARLAQAGAVMAGKTPAQINAHIESLAREVAQRNAALRALDTGTAGTTEGFAMRLEALARGHVDGLWLVRMSMDSHERALALYGRAIDPDRVPSYLQSLARQSSFSGTRFGHLRIERDHKDNAVRFEVSTLQPVADEESGS